MTHGVWEKEVSKQRNLDRVRFKDPANRKRTVSSNPCLCPSNPDTIGGHFEKCPFT